MKSVRPRIKICGVTDSQFLIVIDKLPIDAIGLMFYAGSKRAIDVAVAKTLLKNINPLLQVVAVFVNPTFDEVNEVINNLPIHTLQFHGNESADFCSQFNRPYIKAVAVDSEFNFSNAVKRYPDASAILLDNAKGGTGESFNWCFIPESPAKPVILAGGINANNIGELIKNHQVDTIDLSSGVENAPGEKSIEKLVRLIEVIDEVI